MVLWAAFSEIVAREAQGREATAYGLFTSVAKAALAVGGLGLGWASGCWTIGAARATGCCS